ncbi:MAG: PQQ-dependent sugar dehydrogenase [Pseudohongiellaceae bacterium]
MRSSKTYLRYVAVVVGAAWNMLAQAQGLVGVDGSVALFQENCSVCHGESLEGAALGVPLLGELRHGDTMTEITASIRGGFAETGMPSWQDSLSNSDIRNLALYITESRANIDYETFNYDTPLVIPEGEIPTELHNYTLEPVAVNLDAQSFSISPMPDGSFLLTEKKYGLRIIDQKGGKSDYIKGTPEVFADTFIPTFKQEWGWGWLFDIAPHPDYANNGWIYLYYSERCSDCNATSLASGQPVSMNKLVRARIKEGEWVEQETIWEADKEHYGGFSDIAAGGRMAFDDRGHVYFSIGVKGPNNFEGVQDLSIPWGKIHRIYDDGSIPDDNPFAHRDDVYRSIFTYGHRSPQGLEFNRFNGEVYGTEHGPRGGDELNHLIAGRNYGWPLTSLGMDYDGTPVEYGKDLGITFELADIEQPIVDLTPSPAVSSFVISDSDRFPEWKGHYIVGSLKARSLYRFEIADDRLVNRETLLDGIVRIRDIEMGYNGEIYLLVEHNSGSQILRMAAVD